jgi:hypothetical protein
MLHFSDPIYVVLTLTWVNLTHNGVSKEKDLKDVQKATTSCDK